MTSSRSDRNMALLTAILFCVLPLFTAELLPNPKQAGRKDGYKLQSPLKIDAADIDAAIFFSAQSLDKWRRLEENILSAQNEAHKNITASNAQGDAQLTGRNAAIVEKATIQLITRFCYKMHIPTSKCLTMIADFNATHTHEPRLHEQCMKLEQPCTEQQLAAKYRDYSGVCNHKYTPSLGEALTTYKRLLGAVYADGIHSMRRSVTKKAPLPSPRVVSERMVKREADTTPSARFTVAFAHWGEFVEHDLAQTVSHKMIHFDSSINCCAPEGAKLSPRHLHPFCSAIVVPSDDQFYGRKYVTCLNYVRSMGGLRDDCSFGQLDQLNQATHYLDASHIYGSAAQKTQALRNGIRGQLRHAQNYLPYAEHASNCPDTKNCFKSGDARVNSNPQLTTLHTLFLREHNRIAGRLSNLNPHWNDEKLFEEARRILIAEVQHITYDEWLPLLLPAAELRKMAAGVYQDGVDPSVSNSFATAAIRFIKSMIPDNIQLFNEDRTLNASLKLGEHLYSTRVVQERDLNQFLRGLTTQKSRKLDLTYTKDLVDLHGSDLLGLDVISLDIQRGRDHGLPGYNAYRQLCGLKKAKIFDDLLDNIPPETVKSLSQTYNHPDDIDLIIGGLAEAPKNSQLGDTFACILADQFRRTQAGDRYFYTFAHFTTQQIEEIQKVSLAKIVCDNGGVLSMQPAAFLPISSSNTLRQCAELQGMNLDAWKD